MFIREITKKDHSTGKIYVYHRLMEAIRTPKGPRQRIVLDLGRLDLPRTQLKILADRIEQIVSGQKRLWPVDESLENLALDFARRLKRKERQGLSKPVVPEAEPQWETVDLGSITQEEVRTIGAEALGHWAFNKLGFPGMLKDLGFSPTQITVAALLVIGRLIHPASERGTFLWATERSGLDELLDTDFEKVSLSALYRLSDMLVQHREAIEAHLRKSERSLFGLQERILYDLTNTFLTGTAEESRMAKRGRSKEKRTDCPLLTLALVVDEDGFPKVSKVFEGNVGEPSTLAMILDALPASGQMPLKAAPTVVIDAGVATAENIALIRSRGMDYVCVSRSRPRHYPEGEKTVIKTGSGGTVQGIRVEQDAEILLYCESTGRSAKEQGIRGRLKKGFEEGLAGIAASLEKPRGVKSYDKVLERVGRVRERYSSIAQFYEISVEKTGDQATTLTWRIHNEEGLKSRFCGGYLIRSSRKDLNEERLWSLYTTLTLVEESFRSLKSDLGLRPMYHRKDRRLEGHVFISVCAYHLLATLQRRLRKEGIVHNWEIIRMRMGSQCRVTVCMTNDKGERIHIRQTTEPESFHKEVYRALGISKPLMSLKTVS